MSKATVRRFRMRRGRLTAEKCYRCRTRLTHSTVKDWRALGPKVAIRCLDCRLAFCPKCAKKHFAPVARAHDKLMGEIVKAATKAMRRKCKELT